MKLLNYQGQNLHTFPQSILNHPEITNLNLNDNQITHIPDWISLLKNLKVLYLNNNLLTSFDAICQLPNLEVLHLNNNQILNIPDSIFQLKKLKRIYLNENLLTEVPDNLCRLSGLKQLLLAENQIIQLPRKIGDLINLDTLILFNNKIENLPSSIGNLSRLEYLQLGFNNLTKLPESLQHLNSMSHLDLFSNQLTELSLLKNLDALKHINVGDNYLEHIQNIPQQIESWSIYNNPIKSIDPFITGYFLHKEFDFSAYLFVDRQQMNDLKLNKKKYGKTLKVVDIKNKKIHPLDRKYMPIELQEKWELVADINIEY